ncbi:MAG: hypothetical protein ACE5K4_09310 [Candidatus Hydrothermarchaeota archaeon]
MIKLEKFVRNAKLRSPLLNFDVQEQEIEYRKDPLLEMWVRINVERASRKKQVSEEIDVIEVIKSTQKGCFFCPGNLEKSTPKFFGIEEDGEEIERIKIGNSCIFPNLFPFGKNHAVGIFSGDHFLRIGDFSPKLIKDCISACLKYFQKVHEKQKDARYPLFSWNHMPPSGASIIHPHVQILIEEKPTFLLSKYMEKSRSFYERNKRNFWNLLLEKEKKIGERFIGENDSLAVLTSFAPQGNNEVLILFKEGISSLNQLNDRGIKEFAQAISSILKAYQSLGVQSFTLSTYSGPIDEDISHYFNLNAKIISRPNFQKYYTNDTGFMERLNLEWVVLSKPEEIASFMRDEIHL